MSDNNAEELQNQDSVTPEAAESKEPEVQTDPLQEIQTALEAAQAENTELRDSLLRKQADFDNYRKRMIREREEQSKYANTSLLTDLVAVLDDFERAIKSSESAKDFESFHSGIVMIEQQLVSMLEKKYSLARFSSLGEPFSHDKHEAIAMEAGAGDDQEAVVTDEYQKGYTLYDRVIRTAKVKVGPKIASSIENVKSEGEING